MGDFPTKRRIIAAIRIAVNTPFWSVEDVLDAILDVLPQCEDQESAAFCYEKLEAMRKKKP